MKDRASKKVNIISFRMSDAEREVIQQMMDARDKRASTVVREAFALFLQQWESRGGLETQVSH